MYFAHCSMVMPGSICHEDRCGCPLGYVARKRIFERAECVVGAAPCDIDNPGECATIHTDMVCTSKSYTV